MLLCMLTSRANTNFFKRKFFNDTLDLKLSNSILENEDAFRQFLLDANLNKKWNEYIKLLKQEFDEDTKRMHRESMRVIKEVQLAISKNESFKKFESSSLDEIWEKIKQNFNFEKNNNSKIGKIDIRDILGKYIISIKVQDVIFHLLRSFDSQIVSQCNTCDEFIKKFTKSNLLSSSIRLKAEAFRLNSKHLLPLKEIFLQSIINQIGRDANLYFDEIWITSTEHEWESTFNSVKSSIPENYIPFITISAFIGREKHSCFIRESLESMDNLIENMKSLNIKRTPKRDVTVARRLIFHHLGIKTKK